MPAQSVDNKPLVVKDLTNYKILKLCLLNKYDKMKTISAVFTEDTLI